MERQAAARSHKVPAADWRGQGSAHVDLGHLDGGTGQGRLQEQDVVELVLGDLLDIGLPPSAERWLSRRAPDPGFI